VASSKQKCITCGKDFLVIEQEANFLSEQGYPLPIECSYCRQDRRISLRASRNLVKDKCANCHQDIIVSDNYLKFKFKLFCDQCYKQYNSNHDNIITDLSKRKDLSQDQIFNNFDSFYQEYLRLLTTFPRLYTSSTHSVNCVNGQYNVNCKNLLSSFDNFDSQDSAYINSCYLINDSIDCDYSYESSNSYNSVDLDKCSNCAFINYGDHLTDCYYCYVCSRSHHLFGCIYLTDKAYCIFNRQYSKEEYEKQVSELKKLPPDQIFPKVQELLDNSFLTKSKVYQSENSDYGNYVVYSKNLYLCFDAFNSEDCGYLYDTGYCVNCWDMSRSHGSQVVYEGIEADQVFKSGYAHDCYKCSESFLINDCTQVENCFGCTCLYKKKNCILNRQFSPEIYKQITEKLFVQLKEKTIKIYFW